MDSRDAQFHASPSKPMLERPEVQSILRAIVAISLGMQISLCISYLPIALGGHADFRHLYVAGLLVRSGRGHALYDFEAQKAVQDALISREETVLPFNHLAYEAALFAPLTLLPYRSAYVVFAMVNLVFLVLALWCIRRLVPSSPIPAFAWASFLPIAIAIVQGQDSLLSLALYSLCALQLKNRRDVLGGAVAGLSFFRFQLAIPIFVLFAFWKRWKFCAGFMAAALAACLLSMSIVGVGGAAHYANALRMMAAQTDQSLFSIFPGNMPNIRGLFFGLLNHFFSGIALQAVTLLASMMLIGYAGTKFQPASNYLAFLISIPISALVSYHLLVHDWCFLLLPLSWAATMSKRSEPLAVSAIVVFAVPIFLAFGRSQFFLAAIPLLWFAFTFSRMVRVWTQQGDGSEYSKASSPAPPWV